MIASFLDLFWINDNITRENFTKLHSTSLNSFDYLLEDKTKRLVCIAHNIGYRLIRLMRT